MKKIEDMLITDSLPKFLGSQPEVSALAFAINRQIRQLKKFSDMTAVLVNLDNISENMLDILAIEMNIVQYNTDLDVNIKRILVKNSFVYSCTAGTRYAIKEILADIFGSADIAEWYEYDGSPGYFKVSTENPKITDDNVAEFRHVAESVKRLSAWLDTVELTLSTDEMKINAGFLICIGDILILKQE